MDVKLTRRHALFYDYVTENILELRAPHRPGHIALFQEWKADGRLLLGGALGDPPAGALIVFDVEDPAEIQAFVDADPYVRNGVVTGYRIEVWNTVD